MGYFNVITAKEREKKAYLVINSCNLAVLDYRLFPEAHQLFLPSFLPSSLPPFLRPFLASSLPHSFHFSLSSSIITSLHPAIYIVYLFPVHTAIKPATMYSTTISPFTHLFSLSFHPYTFPTKQAAILLSKLSLRQSIHPFIIQYICIMQK